VIGLSVAVVDPGSLAGRDVRAILRERGFPAVRIHLFHTSEPDAGLLTEDDGEAAFVEALAPDGLEGCQIAFLCGPPEATARFLASRTSDGCLAIDLSGQRGPGAFIDAVRGSLPSPLPPGDLFVLRDPAATVLAEAVASVDPLCPVAGVTVAIDRPASDLGKGALDELFQQAIAIASFRSVPKDLLGVQSAFNLFSPADTDSFDARVASDVKALLGRDLPVTILSARAGVFHGTTLRLELRFEGPAPSVDAVRSALLATGRGFAEPDVDGPAGIVDAAGRDETLLLRSAAGGSAVQVFLASDHLRRPGALLAVQIAEAVVAERGLVPDA
jgi:aspartate-semialdehyde dehydrogenase